MNENSRLLEDSPTRRKSLDRTSPVLSVSSGETFVESFSCGGGIDIREIVQDIMTFEPTDPDELVREVIEYHQNSLQIDTEVVDPTDREDEEQNDHDGFVTATATTASVRRPSALGQDLTYPEEQIIENHYTSSPEKLGVISLAVLVFYNVSGGPFGIETAVRAGGNFYAILGFLIMPFVWSLQEALMTAELGSTFVEASGGVAWVEEAFGPKVGWMSGYLSWISGATDNAIYPVLFLDYLLQVFGNDDESEAINPASRFVLLSATTIFLACVNWRGLHLVGKMSVYICLIAMSPFVILVVVGSFKVDTSRWFILPNSDTDETADSLDDDIAGGFFPNFTTGGVLWRPFLNNLFWNLNSFDNGGTLVAELDSTAPFIRAMMLGVVLVVTCYFFPLLIAIGASDSVQSDWTNGYLAAINTEVVGPWLGAWTVFAAGISNIAMFQAELSSDAFQLMGMADRGHLPKIFSKRSRHGTPTYGLILGTAVIVFMGVSDLDTLIEMLNFNYAIALLLEYAAFFKLRISRPDLERPYRIPLSTFGCCIFFFPTIVATLLVMSLATYTTYYFAFGSWIIGYLVYVAKRQSELSMPVDGNIYEHVAHVAGESLETTDDETDIFEDTSESSESDETDSLEATIS